MTAWAAGRVDEPRYPLAPGDSQAMMVLRRDIAARRTLRRCPGGMHPGDTCDGRLLPFDGDGVPYEPIVIAGDPNRGGRSDRAEGTPYATVYGEGRCDACGGVWTWRVTAGGGRDL